MKKLLYSAVALATLLFAACQQENLEPETAGGNTVTYTISVPGALGTKAIGTNVNAVTELIYEVYRTEAQTADDYDAAEQLLYKRKATITAGTAYLTLELVNKQNFRVLFWAQVPETGIYNTTNLKSVTIGQALTTNMESYAAFAGSDFIKAGDILTGRIVKLHRPVAQLNIATDAESLVIGNGDGAITTTNVEIDNCYVTVTGLSTSYNVAEDAAGEIVESSFIYDRYDENNPPVLSETTLTVKNEPYTYVAMNYLGFAPALGTNVEVYYEIDTNVGTIDNKIGNVPVKPNYRTNIVGNLITETSDYTIILDNEWPDDDRENMEVLVEGLVKNINGDYEVTSEKGLAYAISNLFEEGGNFYLTEDLYDMTGYAVNPPIVASGKTLNVYGETPVVTKSAASVVTIKGLDLTSLIESVAPAGSASFSNICIDSETTFVGTNNGTVVFDNCANAKTENHAELIGDNTNGETIDIASIETLAQLQSVINSGIKTIELTKTLVNAAGSEFILDIKDCQINCIDQTQKNFELIKNQGTLTITGSGKLAVEATINNGWNRYSAVIANTVGGNLTVEGVTIEHHGGTDMAYGIDNLTNGKNTSAVVTIDGAIVKSPYRAVRQFLNGTEANNSLTVKTGSKLFGENKSIFFHDPNANANSGNLVVEEGAELNGGVYLFVTAGSTQWPVSVSIAESSLAEGSEITYANVPENYTVEKIGGIWKVICYTEVAPGLMYNATGNTYRVSSAAGLAYFSNKTATDGTVINLIDDIDFDGAEFKAVAAGYSKSLTFNGNGHTISNVKLVTCSHNSVDAASLFYCYPGGAITVSDLIVDGAVSEGATYAGTILGYTQGNATLTDITVKNATISGVKKIGGLVGFVEASTSSFLAENCKVIDTTVEATEKQAGTIIGYNAKPATLKNCTVETSTATAPAYCDGGVRCTDPAQAELTVE